MFSALHSCGHVSNWRESSTCPNVGEHMTCAHCGLWVTVTDVFGPWRVKCLDCHRLDGHATFKKTVVMTATRHVQERTWRSHRVKVWQFGNKDSVRVITAQEVGTQAQLTGTEGAPF